VSSAAGRTRYPVILHMDPDLADVPEPPGTTTTNQPQPKVRVPIMQWPQRAPWLWSDNEQENNVSTITAGDTIHHHSIPAGTMDVTVLGIVTCEDGDHPAFEITDPETGEPDTVCSLEFVKA
jgi:hypothetical protein